MNKKWFQIVYRFLSQTEDCYFYDHIIILKAKRTTQTRETVKQKMAQFFHIFLAEFKAGKSRIGNSLGNLEFTIGFLFLQN